MDTGSLVALPQNIGSPAYCSGLDCMITRFTMVYQCDAVFPLRIAIFTWRYPSAHAHLIVGINMYSGINVFPSHTSKVHRTLQLEYTTASPKSNRSLPKPYSYIIPPPQSGTSAIRSSLSTPIMSLHDNPCQRMPTISRRKVPREVFWGHRGLMAEYADTAGV